ncbi:ParB/Srx family N-terminal domain-containing protein [Photobacterium indicum]|uniref:Nuclease n=1 Tax=Photobacterium indicum TaxID=81447 RepID=A0A2T3LF60_9GAMM|nr:ParB/Srx family N-terminal domain-containing protein [Photobacterium indicum]PSV50020.1 nuclease [Photobacterium indicum]
MTKNAKKEQFHEYVHKSVHDLQEYEKNPNIHDEKNISELAASIKEWGFTNPILIDESDMIIAGHGRWEAAKFIGMEVVPCIILAGLSDSQKAAYVIADNSLPFGSKWDEDLLLQEIEQLEADGFNIDLLALDNIEDLDFAEFQPSSFTDGHAKDGDETVNKADTKLTIGEYSIPIPREMYIRWQDDIRNSAGFSKENVTEEIKRRLQLW